MEVALMPTQPLVFDAAVFSKATNIPQQFVWPEEDTPKPDAAEELVVPLIDLGGLLLSGDLDAAAADAIRQIDEACRAHGFFQIANHGVDAELIAAAQRGIDEFFTMPLAEKQRAQRKPGESYGYASSFTGRFETNLPWKETLSLQFSPPSPSTGRVVHEYFVDTLGEDFLGLGEVFQEYAEALGDLSLRIMEVLGLTLGVGRAHFRDFFEGHDSIVRLNYYPVCQRPDITLGTGPHRDPVGLTVLHQQEDVDGLQVLIDGKWRTIAPTPNAFVINIGDTFMALSNGNYQSCIHRAVVNEKKARKSMAFFLCPAPDKIVRPPPALLHSGHPPVYPDFTWPAFREYTQKHYRADVNTLDSFAEWIRQAGRKE